MASLSRCSVVVFGILGSLLALTSSVQAQICVGSHLAYIVRDAKGRPVDAAAKSFTFGGDAEGQSWYFGDKGYSSFAAKVPAEILTALKNTISPMQVSRICVFRSPVTLRVTMSEQTMDLTFNVPALQAWDSRSFLVDGLPFQEGHFEVMLAVNQNDHSEHSYFYPAKDWTKK
jgi:hypothetical protein